jgi:predicted nucleotidyltransferase
MRLTPRQAQAIKREAAAEFGTDARVILFGSRADDRLRGGDIDLMVALDHPVEHPAVQASRFCARLQLALGEQRIDVLLDAPNLPRQSVHDAAWQQGIPL